MPEPLLARDAIYACGHTAPERPSTRLLREHGLLDLAKIDAAAYYCPDCLRAHDEILRREMDALTGRVTGSKYDGNLSLKEIAKRVRKDIKEAVAAGVLRRGTYSVRSHSRRRENSLSVETTLKLSAEQHQALEAIPKAYQREVYYPTGDRYIHFYLFVDVPRTPLEAVTPAEAPSFQPNEGGGAS